MEDLRPSYVAFKAMATPDSEPIVVDLQLAYKVSADSDTMYLHEALWQPVH